MKIITRSGEAMSNLWSRGKFWSDGFTNQSNASSQGISENGYRSYHFVSSSLNDNDRSSCGIRNYGYSISGIR